MWLGDDASVGRKESKWAEYKGKYGFIGIGARPAVISGHVVVIKCNVLQCSGGASFSFTCSINHGHCRSAFNTLAHNKRTGARHVHTHNLTRARLHTQMLLLEWKPRLKKMNAANNHPSDLQNNNRGDTELICIKTCNICNPPEYTDNQQSLATLSVCRWALQEVYPAAVLSL